MTTTQKNSVLKMNGDDELAKSDYETAKGNSAKIIYEPDRNMIQYIRNMISSNNVMDWSVSTKLNRYIEYIFFKRLKNIILCIRNNREDREQENIQIAKECVEYIIQGGYDCVIDIHQVVTAYRTLALCQCLLGIETKKSIDNINAALYTYADVSSINGVILTILYRSIIFLISYRDNKNSELLKEAENDLKVARRLLFECGLKKYYKRLILVYILYAFIKLKK